MSDVTVNFDLTRIAKEQKKLLQPVMSRIALHAMREAKANAPRSPTVKQVSATLVRKRRSAQRKVPGGLEKSITKSVEQTQDGIIEAHIFVPTNSAAGKYAVYIHDKKNIKWFKRGIGTQAKGSRADDKFIARAVNGNIRRYSALILAVIEKATKVK